MAILWTLHSPIFTILETVAKKLEGKNVNWAVMTSCGLALHGLNIVPDDIDILTDLDGLAEIDCALSDYKVALLQHSPSGKFDSVMSRFLIHDIMVEVIADFNIRSAIDDQWHNVDEFRNDCCRIKIDSICVPVLSPQKLLILYRLMGREKDRPKILALENYLGV